jgi:hypothetical protein
LIKLSLLAQVPSWKDVAYDRDLYKEEYDERWIKYMMSDSCIEAMEQSILDMESERTLELR